MTPCLTSRPSTACLHLLELACAVEVQDCTSLHATLGKFWKPGLVQSKLFTNATIPAFTQLSVQEGD